MIGRFGIGDEKVFVDHGWLVTDKVHVENLSGYAIQPFVVLQSQNDSIFVISVEQRLVQLYFLVRLSIEDIVCELVERLPNVRLHGLANRVLPL